jgi:iron complex transport system substrate-binding protein
MLKRAFSFSVVLWTAALGLAACRPAVTAPPNVQNATACVSNYNANTDYFPNKSSIVAANGFKLQYFSNYKLLSVPQAWAGDQPRTYVLLQCGTPLPSTGIPAEAVVINVPVQRTVALSTTYLPYFEKFALLSDLVAIENSDYVYSPAVKQAVGAGQIATVGGGAEIDIEKTLSLQPDVIFAYGSGSPDYDAHPKLQAAGLNVVLLAEFLEPTPLGRAEWGKAIAAFFNQEAAANIWFDGVSDRYNSLRASAQASPTQPSVLKEAPYQGVWYVPGGQSFAAKLLADAGANYVWAADPHSGSLTLDFETVFANASSADFWLDVGFVNSLAELQASDQRFGEFASVHHNKVYNNNKRLGENGGNDYYESGTASPDVLLADLVEIFHPDLQDHQLVYYQPLP